MTLLFNKETRVLEQIEELNLQSYVRLTLMVTENLPVISHIPERGLLYILRAPHHPDMIWCEHDFRYVWVDDNGFLLFEVYFKSLDKLAGVEYSEKGTAVTQLQSKMSELIFDKFTGGNYKGIGENEYLALLREDEEICAMAKICFLFLIQPINDKENKCNYTGDYGSFYHEIVEEKFPVWLPSKWKSSTTTTVGSEGNISLDIIRTLRICSNHGPMPHPRMEALVEFIPSVKQWRGPKIRSSFSSQCSVTINYPDYNWESFDELIDRYGEAINGWVNAVIKIR